MDFDSSTIDQRAPSIDAMPTEHDFKAPSLDAMPSDHDFNM